ncbi:class II aldolase and Adducin N-terminal domain-containing protein [Mycena sp. CBHHK59/15]|nr:class II aldolase and Adducin N-terminal domain-containing protein [Mycena sp. CBHHK59/15]
MRAASTPAEILFRIASSLPPTDILHFLGVVDALGHVSVRNPANASQFLMTFSIAPAQATSKSIVTYEIENATAVSLTFNSSVTGASVPTGFSERFIHSEILKAFPDVLAVVHGHTEEVLPFANQASVPLVAQIHTHITDNQLHDLLVRNELLGDALARKFSNDSQRTGHGMVVRGTSIRDAVFRSYYVKQNAAAQFQGILLGGGRPPKSLSRREATDASTTDDGLVGRAWSLWAQQADNAGLYVNDLRNGSAPPPT